MKNTRKESSEQEVRVIDLNQGDIRQLISDILDEKLHPITSLLNSRKDSSNEFFTRKETAEMLSITLPTLWEWTRIGIIKSYKISRRVFYKAEDIDEAMQLRTAKVRK